MGRKDKWYSKIKKVLNPGSTRRIKAKAKKSSSESGSKRFGSQSQIAHPAEAVVVCHPPIQEDVGFIETNSDQQNKGAQFSERAAFALAPKIALAIAQRITVAPNERKSKEDVAAIRIQTVYRCYLAKRTLRALKGLVRLKFLVQGQAVKRQSTDTLKCMQALARVQSQVRSRRVQMSQENQALRKQLLQKSAKKHTAFRNSEDWKDCAQSKEQEEAKLKKKHEAALRRERTLAYSSTHQQTWKNSPKRTSDATVMNPDNPSWGWSWLERWMAGRPWEGQNASAEGEVDPRQEIAEVEDTRETQTPHKPPPGIKIAPKSPPNPVQKLAEDNKPGSSRMRLSNGSASDSSERNRRQSFGGSSARDYESSAGSKSPRRHTMPAMSLNNTKPRLHSPLGMETPRKSSTVRQAEKPLSHIAPHISNLRRQSAPPKVRNTNLTVKIS